MEDKTLNEPQQWAVMDICYVMELLAQVPLDKTHFSLSSEWLVVNVERLLSLFQQQWAPVVPETQPSSATHSFPTLKLPLPTTNFYLTAEIDEKLSLKTLTQRQRISDTRIRQNEKYRYLLSWQNAVGNFIGKQLADILFLQKAILEGLQLPLVWTQEEYQSTYRLLEKLWEKDNGLAILSVSP